MQKKILAQMSLQKDIYSLIIDKRITDDFFDEGLHRIIFRLFFYYYKAYFTFPSQDDVKYLIDNSKHDDDIKSNMLAFYVGLVTSPVEQNNDFIINTLIKEHKSKLTTDMLLSTAKLVQDGNLEKAMEVVKSGVVTCESLGKANMGSVEVTKTTQETIDEYDESKSGKDQSYICSGFKTLDNCTKGIEPGQLWIVEGWLKAGKSMFLLNIGYNAWLTGKNVLYVSAELGEKQIRRRFHSRASELPYNQIKFATLNAENEEKYKNFVSSFKDRPNYFEIMYQPGCSTLNILQKINALKMVKKPDMVIVDYIGIMTPMKRGSSHHENIGNVGLELRNMAGSEQVAMWAAHQQNREGKMEDKEGAEYASGSIDIPRHADIYMSIKVDNDDEKELTGRYTISARTLASRDSEGCSFKCQVWGDRMMIKEKNEYGNY